jgi:hypothetical protein
LKPQTIKHNNNTPPPPTKTGKKGFTNKFKTPNKTQKNPLFSKFNTSAAKLEEDYLCEREKKE